MAGRKRAQRPARYFAGKPSGGGNSDSDEEESQSDGERAGIELKIGEVTLPEESSEGEYVTEDEDEQEDNGTGQQQGGQGKGAGIVGTARPETAARDEQQGDQDDKDEEEESEDESEDESEEESEEDRPVLVRPRFISKDKRKGAGGPASNGSATTQSTVDEPEKPAQNRSENASGNDVNPGSTEPDSRRKATLALIERSIRQEQLAEAARFADDADELAAVDDTDGLDPDAELAAWVERERARMKRERDELAAEEREHEELERRRALTEEERLAEDADRLERKSGPTQARYMQRYYHRGAFYQDDELLKRDFSEAVEDDYKDKRVLPKALQVRSGVGLKGQTKYRSLREEDTLQNDDLTRLASKRRRRS